MERRSFGRRATQLQGWIRVPGRPVQACRIENMTVDGALIRCPNAEALPFSFELVIDSAGFRSTCSARHRTADTIGVAFTDRQRTVPAEPGQRTAETRSATGGRHAN